MRTIMMLGFVTGAFALALACSSSDDGSSSGGASSSGENASGGASGNNTSGGSSGNNASGGSSGQSNAFKDCSQNTGSCTQEELEPYTNCLTTKCDSVYVQCYGPNYKNGDFAGPCASYITCVQKCDCADQACLADCVINMGQECMSCGQHLSTCSETCQDQAPECAKQAPEQDAGNATCDDLKACCDKMPDGGGKDACNAAYSGAQGNDATCSTLYLSFKALCP